MQIPSKIISYPVTIRWPLWLTYGNWGGPGYSAGVYNDDPAATDKTVPGIDKMDEAFKVHDLAYQASTDPDARDAADRELVKTLKELSTEGMNLHARLYRYAAIAVFTVFPYFRN